MSEDYKPGPTETRETNGPLRSLHLLFIRAVQPLDLLGIQRRDNARVYTFRLRRSEGRVPSLIDFCKTQGVRRFVFGPGAVR